MKRILTLIVCAIALCGDLTVCGQTTFTGANSNEFNDPGNWDNGLPNDNNAGIIPSGLVVVNNGVLDNDFNYFSSIAIYGTFVNNGSILPSTGDLYNHGAVVNKGHLTCFNHNYGSFINYSEAYVEAESFDLNSGFILNQGVMSIGFGEDGNQGIIYTCSQQRKDSKTKAEEGVVCTCREVAGTFSSLIRGLKCATRCRLLGTLALSP